LRAKQNLAPVEMIRGKPAERQQQELRPNCNPITIPTAVAFRCVNSVRTIQSCAVRCIYEPILDTSAPTAQIR
jgi:hypothetical protein